MLDHRAQLEQINRCRISFSDTVGLLTNQIAGMDYEIACLKGQLAQRQAELT